MIIPQEMIILQEIIIYQTPQEIMIQVILRQFP